MQDSRRRSHPALPCPTLPYLSPTLPAPHLMSHCAQLSALSSQLLHSNRTRPYLP